MKVAFAVMILAAMLCASDFQVYRPGEIAEIIERMIMHESHSNATCVNQDEYSVGLMQVTKIARDEFNSWTGKNYNYWTMFDPSSNREVGCFLLTNILLRYRCNHNIVQAVASYNIGIHNVQKNGYYPDDYLKATIPWYWSQYQARFKIADRWRDKGIGAWIVKLRGADGNPPRMGL